MREECEEQTDLTAWVNKAERIVTFQETEGFERKLDAYDSERYQDQ